MKESTYNFFFDLEDGRMLAYNSRLNGLALIDKKVRDAINQLCNLLAKILL